MRFCQSVGPQAGKDIAKLETVQKEPREPLERWKNNLLRGALTGEGSGSHEEGFGGSEAPSEESWALPTKAPGGFDLRLGLTSGGGQSEAITRVASQWPQETSQRCPV